MSICMCVCRFVQVYTYMYGFELALSIYIRIHIYIHFLIFFHVPNTFWWLLNFERYVHVYLSFRCIFLICSCHLSNHPSILWTILYPSPDDGYYNRNVNVDFTSWYIHLFGLYFFLLPSYIYIYIYIYIYAYVYIYIYIYKWIKCIWFVN